MLTPEAVASIVSHMNEDHADALTLYARAFGGCPEASAVRMIAIDATGVVLAVGSAEGVEEVRIELDERLQTPMDARRALIRLAAAAQEKLGL